MDELTLHEGAPPDGQLHPQPADKLEVVLDGAGEAYIRRSADPQWNADRDDWNQAAEAALAVCVPQAREVTGRLFWLRGAGETSAIIHFSIPADAFQAEARRDFLQAERAHYTQLLADGVPGAAWWRHRVDALSRELGETQPADRPQGWASPSNMDDTFALFSGGRAVAENLQLDRTLPATPPAADDDVRDVDSLAGITVAEYDWSAAVAGKSPRLDALAALIPADQHALFFPSFTAMADMADRMDEQGTVVLEALSDPAEEARSRQRYEQQLGLPMTEIARLLGPQLIRSVAMTGGDPYLRAGSDVAVLLEANDPAVLLSLVLARVAAATASEPGCETKTGTSDGLEWTARVSPGRRVSSYVARLGGAVVVSNSPAQLARLATVGKGSVPALSALPEYVFFRDRYPLGDAAETALLVVSDPCIRRWCGPRWRIGDSRRTRAEAQLAELQAAAADDVAHGKAGGLGPLADAPAGLGTVERTADGVRSSLYGTLGFLTPIAELDLARVSAEEADLYGRWRDGYQNNFTGVFDPLAVRFSLGPQRLGLDLTIRPLIAGTEYREFLDMCRGAKIAPQACDPHDDALLQVVMAVDSKSSLFGEGSGMLRAMLPQMDPLAWLGSSVSLYVEDGPLWDEVRRADVPDDALEAGLARLPVALHAEVGNPLLLTGALVALRGLADQSAPGMLRWENATFEGEPYVVVRPTQDAMADSGMPADLAVRYAPSAEGLVLTLDQSLLERALKRRIGRRAARSAQPPPAWLGDQLCVRVDGKLLGILDDIASKDRDEGLRALSFANLPILNEWHHLFPGEDPVATHQRLFQRELACPGGGSYRWNEEWQTMESSVYGHPGAPKRGPSLPPALLRLASAQAGLTFEADGLRARVELVMRDQ
ncbi:MAG TPA: hypothetical protein VFY71_18895 [Planctomycetota bacterium]|nr:hypothetical protein [Planctomycetota bacterium]